MGLFRPPPPTPLNTYLVRKHNSAGAFYNKQCGDLLCDFNDTCHQNLTNILNQMPKMGLKPFLPTQRGSKQIRDIENMIAQSQQQQTL